MRRPGTDHRLGVALACAAILVAGCGSSDDGSKPTSAGSGLTIKITAPADGSTTKADRVTVRGTVSSPEAQVQVLGVAAQVGNGVFTQSVPLHGGANTIDVVASAPGAAPATASVTVTRKSTSTPPSRKKKPRGNGDSGSGGSTAPPMTTGSNCGAGLNAGAHTSCAFAENVRAAYEQTGSGVLDVYSPTTGQTYRMYCTSGVPHVCTGGNGASVYFYSGSTAVTYDTNACGGGTVVGPNTSCAFAENVRAEYYRSGGGTISVYSPTTGRSYTMYCSDGSPHACTGGNNAAVYFP